MDDACARKVALTSPVTLWAVLKSVAYAWQQQSLTDDAKTLFDLSRELYERFAVLGERANKLGTALTRTVTAYNRHRWNPACWSPRANCRSSIRPRSSGR